MLLLVIAVAAVLFLILDFGAIHFGVDSRDGFGIDPAHGMGVEALGPRLR